MTLDEKARVEEIGRTYTMERIYKLEDWNGSKVLWVHYDVQFLLAQLTAANAKIDDAYKWLIKHLEAIPTDAFWELKTILTEQGGPNDTL